MTVATAVVSYTPQAGDPDPLTNTVTASGTGADSGAEASDEASCTTDITHEPGIDVTKSCPESVPFGEDDRVHDHRREHGQRGRSVGVTVNDTLLGDITGDFDFDFANPFPVGAVATAVVSYTPQAGDPDPLTNTVTASGTGADSGVEASDEASCTTDIEHQPGIDVTKSCPESVPFGEAIEYTITVENTGNEALVGVTVNDSLLGDITGDFDFDFANPFPVGEIATAVVVLHAAGRRPRPAHQHGDRVGHRCGLGCGGLRRGVLHHRHPEPDHRRGEVLHRAGPRRRHGHLHDHRHQHR